MINGLNYISDFIDQETENILKLKIDENNWSNDLKRRTQQYGYKYDYTVKTINYSMKINDLPVWTKELIDKFISKNLIKDIPDQLIINEYLPGQGIANHIDCVPCFKDIIISLSLLSSCVMNFTNKHTKEVVPLLLDPKSLVVLENEARYDWFHGIPSRKSDEINGIKFNRERRVSLTFRKVII